jgi:sporulation protein YqfC
MSDRKRKKRNQPVIQPPHLKEKVTDMLELPKEAVLNLPMISMIGNGEMNIENYKVIIEYNEERIRIHTMVGVLKLEGRKLLLKAMTTEEIVITGIILKIEILV